jgi:hypothetical protein
MSAFDGGLSPKLWSPPTRQPFQLASVRAGEWVLVELCFRDTNVDPMVYLPGCFLAHVVYIPNSDDSTAQKIGGRLQPVIYGGSSDKKRSEYHWDVGLSVQVPWDGQISVVAGGDSLPGVQVDVTIKRGFQPEDLVRDPHGEPDDTIESYDPATFLNVEAPAMLSLAYEDVDFARDLFADAPPLDAGPMRAMRSKRVFPPPVIGPPGLVSASYMMVPPLTVIPFASGVVSMEAFDNTGIPSNPIAFMIMAMGNPEPFRFWVQNGATPRTLGALAQGGGATNAVQATWAPLVGLATATVWSRLGN